jgi:hypothetical protein
MRVVLVLLLLSPAQVFALLATRYLSCWDVRYHTLRTLTRLAQQRAVRSESAAAAAAAAGSAAATAGSDDEDEQQQQQLQKSAADVSRAMFDVLAAVQPIMPQQKQQQQEEEEEEEVPSWCGASEVIAGTQGGGGWGSSMDKGMVSFCWEGRLRGEVKMQEVGVGASWVVEDVG